MLPIISIVIGGLLTAVGIVAYTSPDMLGEGKPYQPTALSPAVIGGLLILCGLISVVKPSVRKHAMHFAAMLGVFGTIGGFVPLVLRKFDFSQTAAIVGLNMTLLSLVFTVLCVNSFIQARKARKVAAAV
jgi:hypothetical protein